MIAFALSCRSPHVVRSALSSSICTPSPRTKMWLGPSRVCLGASAFLGCFVFRCRAPSLRNRGSRFRISPSAMFSGGGILGVGPSEIFVIVAVGWLLLGPEKLFALAKDSGKFIGQLRRTADEAKGTFTEALEMDMVSRQAQNLKLENESGEDGKSSEESKPESKAVSGAETHLTALQSPVVGEPLDSAQELSTLEREQLSASNKDFLDQLRRVADPKQVSPTEVPDLSSELDDELELQRLEREYLAAKSKVERRRQVPNSADTGDTDTAPER